MKTRILFLGILIATVASWTASASPRGADPESKAFTAPTRPSGTPGDVDPHPPRSTVSVDDGAPDRQISNPGHGSRVHGHPQEFIIFNLGPGFAPAIALPDLPGLDQRSHPRVRLLEIQAAPGLTLWVFTSDEP